MGKRSSFERREKDFYPTPYEAILPLLPHLLPKTRFIEPCAGDGRLIDHLQKHGHVCTYACDIEPMRAGIQKEDVLFFGFDLANTAFAECIITNPPWERNQDGTGPLHEMIEKFRNHLPTWLLFDADWMHTGQFKEFLRYCSKIISVGRVSWMENGTSGMDNCAWYNFQKEHCETKFINQ